jgi:diacylglycerol kinase
VYAFNGLWQLFINEPNAKLHALATIGVIVAGVVRHIGPMQWAAVTFAIGLVWITEAINTALERLCDYCCGDKWDPAIKVVKDIAAGAVLISAITSIAICFIVFFL